MDDKILTSELIRDEGLRLKPYRDTLGNLTIGVGRNLEDRGISRLEALGMLKNDIFLVKAELDKRYPWWKSLPDPAQRVLANLCFNIGIARLGGFTKFLAALKRLDWQDAADELLDSKYATQVPNRAYRLAKELESMLS